MPKIQRVRFVNMKVYAMAGKKFWHELNRERDHMARCTIGRRPIGYFPQAEAGENYYQQQAVRATVVV